MKAGRLVGRSLAIILIVVIAIAAYLTWSLRHVAVLPAQPAASVAASSLLTDSIPDTVANAEQVRRGQYLVRVGDCLSCHLAADGEPFAGGLGLNTPFGVIYSSNITSDKKSGIGDWTPEQFYRAMHDGIGHRGEHLYPAFPYPWFARVPREDDDAMLEFLKTVPAVDKSPPANALPFPLNVRGMVAGWNLLFFRTTTSPVDPTQSADWNRGEAIVNGLGHCGACHTPKNVLGADKSTQRFHGGVLDNFVAPDLTSNARTGLGNWNADDIKEYLRTGRNAHASAGGSMADVVTYSTALLSDEDLSAIATYLKSQPASDAVASAAPEDASVKRGAQVYLDACTACHLADGVGQPRLFPPLGKNAVVQQPDPTGVVHIVLAGSRAGPTPTRPSPLTMPSFAWKLTDQEIADVTTFLRNNWGNQADGVRADQVRSIRKQLDLETIHLTDNSGDHEQ